MTLSLDPLDPKKGIIRKPAKIPTVSETNIFLSVRAVLIVFGSKYALYNIGLDEELSIHFALSF